MLWPGASLYERAPALTTAPADRLWSHGDAGIAHTGEDRMVLQAIPRPLQGTEELFVTPMDAVVPTQAANLAEGVLLALRWRDIQVVLHVCEGEIAYRVAHLLGL